MDKAKDIQEVGKIDGIKVISIIFCRRDPKWSRDSDSDSRRNSSL